MHLTCPIPNLFIKRLFLFHFKEGRLHDPGDSPATWNRHKPSKRVLGSVLCIEMDLQIVGTSLYNAASLSAYGTENRARVHISRRIAERRVTTGSIVSLDRPDTSLATHAPEAACTHAKPGLVVHDIALLAPLFIAIITRVKRILFLAVDTPSTLSHLSISALWVSSRRHG